MKRKADVIYDGLGKEAAQENYEALALRGHWVSYGQASGAHESFPDLTREIRNAVAAGAVPLHRRASATRWPATCSVRCATARIRVDVRHRYPLAAAADAHRDLEARRTSGQVVLLP